MKRLVIFLVLISSFLGFRRSDAYYYPTPKLKQIAWSADSRTLAVFGNKRSTSAWIYDVADLTKPRQKIPLPASVTWVDRMAFSPDGNSLAIVSGEYLYLWNIQAAKFTLTLDNYDYISSAVFSPDGRYLIYAGGYNIFLPYTISIWDLKQRNYRATLYGHSNSIRTVGFVPNSDQLYSYADDLTFRLWTIDSNRNPSVIKLNESLIKATYLYMKSLALTPDGSILAVSYSGYNDKTYVSEMRVGLMNLQNHQKIGVLQLPSADFDIDDFLADGQTLLIADDKSFALWDGQSAKVQFSVVGKQPQLSPDRGTIAYRDDNGQIYLWDTQQHKITGTITLPT